MDENRFVEQLRSRFPFSGELGIGDDAAVIKKKNGYSLITQDILIEDVHFNSSWFSPGDIARKSLRVNLSDIAAMGGEPEYYFLALGIPVEFRGAKLDRFLRTLEEENKRWGVELAGGDISFSPHGLFVSITMMGIAAGPVIRRDGARPGHRIGITRGTGESSVGLALLQNGIDIPCFSECHRHPEPELEKGKALSGYASAMIDVSDGLLMDLGRIMTASGTGAELIYEHIPVTERMREVCRDHQLDEQKHVLAGGEDFALLFTLTPENEKKVRAAGMGYSIIGNVTESGSVRVFRNGKEIRMKTAGYDHFGE